MDYEILRGRVEDSFSADFYKSTVTEGNYACFVCTEAEKEWIEKWSGDFKDIAEEFVEDLDLELDNVEFKDFSWDGNSDYICVVKYKNKNNKEVA